LLREVAPLHGVRPSSSAQ